MYTHNNCRYKKQFAMFVLIILSSKCKIHQKYERKRYFKFFSHVWDILIVFGFVFVHIFYVCISFSCKMCCVGYHKVYFYQCFVCNILMFTLFMHQLLHTGSSETQIKTCVKTTTHRCGNALHFQE